MRAADALNFMEHAMRCAGPMRAAQPQHAAGSHHRRPGMSFSVGNGESMYEDTATRPRVAPGRGPAPPAVTAEPPIMYEDVDTPQPQPRPGLPPARQPGAITLPRMQSRARDTRAAAPVVEQTLYEDMAPPSRPSAAPPSAAATSDGCASRKSIPCISSSPGTIWLHGRIERDEVASVGT